jgi:hypothetical protein
MKYSTIARFSLSLTIDELRQFMQCRDGDPFTWTRQSLINDDAPLPANAIVGRRLPDHVTPTFKAGSIGTLKVLLLLRSGLLNCGSLIIISLLLSLPCTTCHGSCYSTNCSALAGVTANRANRSSTSSPASGTSYPFTSSALLRWRGRVLGGLRRIVTRLPLGPCVTLGLILLLLC